MNIFTIDKQISGKKSMEYTAINISSHQTTIIPQKAKVSAPKKLDFLFRDNCRRKKYIKTPAKKGCAITIIDQASI